MNQKSLIAVLGVVIVILISTIAYFAILIKKTSKSAATVSSATSQATVATPKTTRVTNSQQPVQQGVNQQSPVKSGDETAEWQIYTNTKYGFEMKYPNDWHLVQNMDTNQLPSFKHDSLNPNDLLDGDIIEMGSAFDGAHTLSKGSIAANIEEIKKTRVNNDLGDLISVGMGLNIFYTIFKPAGGGDAKPLATIIGIDSAFQFMYLMKEEGTTTDQADKMLKKIIATFRFTKYD